MGTNYARISKMEFHFKLYNCLEEEVEEGKQNLRSHITKLHFRNAVLFLNGMTK